MCQNRTFLLIACLLSPAVLGACTLDLDASVERYALESVVGSHEDKSGNLQLADVVALPEAAWITGAKKTLNFGFTESAYWFTLTVSEKTPTDERWLLKIAYPHLDSIDATAAFARVLAVNPADRVSQLYHARSSQRQS